GNVERPVGCKGKASWVVEIAGDDGARVLGCEQRIARECCNDCSRPSRSRDGPACRWRSGEVEARDFVWHGVSLLIEVGGRALPLDTRPVRNDREYVRHAWR